MEQNNSCMFEFLSFRLPTSLGQPMHCPEALTKHALLNCMVHIVELIKRTSAPPRILSKPLSPLLSLSHPAQCVGRPINRRYVPRRIFLCGLPRTPCPFPLACTEMFCVLHDPANTDFFLALSLFSKSERVLHTLLFSR